MINRMVEHAIKILIVEDNKLLQQVFFDRLVKEGYLVLQAFNGQQGLTMATNYNPNLIILDIMLPGDMNGFDILTRLRSNEVFKQTPIIMLTDLKNEEQTAKKLGATDFLVKSEKSTDELLPMIKERLKFDFVAKIKDILK